MALSLPGADGKADGMTENGQQPQKIHITEQAVAVVRERVPMDALTGFFGRAFGAVMAAVQMQGASPAGPPFALYHGIPGETVDVEAGFPIAGRFRRRMPSKLSTPALMTPWGLPTMPSGNACKLRVPPLPASCGSTTCPIRKSNRIRPRGRQGSSGRS